MTLNCFKNKKDLISHFFLKMNVNELHELKINFLNDFVKFFIYFLLFFLFFCEKIVTMNDFSRLKNFCKNCTLIKNKFTSSLFSKKNDDILNKKLIIWLKNDYSIFFRIKKTRILKVSVIIFAFFIWFK